MRSNDRFIALVIGDVLRSFNADPGAAIATLRPLITTESLLAHGYNDAPAIARELPNAYLSAPDFVAEVYAAIFANEERSSESVDMTGSQIFGFKSNRRQDYDHAKWQLGQDYRKYLVANPLSATRAMAAVTNSYAGKNVRDHRERPMYRVRFRKQTYLFEGDLSRIWDDSIVHAHDPEYEILTEWFAWMAGIAKSDKALFDQALELALDIVRYGVFWRRLLKSGIANPDTVGRDIGQLLTQRAILQSYDTTDVAGALISTSYPFLEISLRTDIVEKIKRLRQRDRLRLLDCVPEPYRDARVQDILAKSEERIQKNRIERGFTTTIARFTSEDFLREQGVDVEKAANRLVREKAGELSNSTSVFKQGGKTVVTTENLIAQSREVMSALRATDVDPQQAIFGWNAVAEASEALAYQAPITGAQRHFILKALNSVLAIKSTDWDSNFDEHGSWGGPAPQVPAASAAMALAGKTWDADTARVVRKASRVSFRPARAQIAGNLLRLYKSAPQEMWTLVRHFALRDPSPRVVSYLVQSTLPWLLGQYGEKASPLLDAIYKRFNGSRKGRAHIRKLCRDLYVDRSLMRTGDKQADAVVRSVISKRMHNHEAFNELVFRLRVHLSETQKGADVTSNRFKRAIRLLEYIVSIVASDRRNIESLLQANDVTESQRSRISSVFKNQAEVATQIRFIIYRDNQDALIRKANADGPAANEAQLESGRIELVKLLLPAVLQLANGASPAAAHSLLEGLEPYVDDLPGEIFPVIASIIRGARDVGFGSEYMAATIVVRIIEKYMTQYPHVIEEDEERRRAFIECLDIFATWPEAIRLVYRFDQVFR